MQLLVIRFIIKMLGGPTGENLQQIQKQKHQTEVTEN